MTFPDKPYVSLEDPDIRAFALSDPRGLLSQHQGGAIFDEIQRAPELTSYLQGVVDADPEPGRYIVTGSQHFGLIEGVSQSLAGRTAVVHLLPLGVDELRRFPDAPTDLFETLVRGAYPAIFDRQVPAKEWLAGYTRTYVERDVRQVLNVTDLLAFQTFIGLCAGHTAQLVNFSSLASAAGITHNTARAWLSVLEASFLVHRLPPFHANIKKRLVKTPKLHFYDSGLACYLLGIDSADTLVRHPSRGAIFESWVVSEVLKTQFHKGLEPRTSFYRDVKRLEVDLLVELGQRLLAIEIKSARTLASDFFHALDDFVTLLGEISPERQVEPMLVYGGDQTQKRSRGTVVPWHQVPSLVE